MKAWEHRLTSSSVYSAVFSFAAHYDTVTTLEYFSLGFFSTLFGAHFPDYDILIFGPGSSPEGFINIKGHRGIMHYYKTYIKIYIPLIILLLISRLYFNYLGFFPLLIFSLSCFFFGIFMHILEDDPTSAGIPVKKFNDELYIAHSCKIGKFDSLRVMFLALSITAVSLICVIYNVLTKFL